MTPELSTHDKARLREAAAILRDCGADWLGERLMDLVVGRPPHMQKGDRVRLRADRDLAGFEGVVVDFEARADGRHVHVELAGAARGTWAFKPEWLEPARRPA